MTLNIIKLSINNFEFFKFSKKINRDHLLDTDYLIHSFLYALLNHNEKEKAFKNFTFNQTKNITNVYFYSYFSKNQIIQRLKNSDPLILNSVKEENLFVKSVPLLKNNSIVGAQIRLRPTKRNKENKEIDSIIGENRDRFIVYNDWVKNLFYKKQFEVNKIIISSFKLTKSIRRDFHSKNNKKIILPEIIVNTNLVVSDNLQDLLYNGIGRHKAFGYGMLCLMKSF